MLSIEFSGLSWSDGFEVTAYLNDIKLQVTSRNCSRGEATQEKPLLGCMISSIMLMLFSFVNIAIACIGFAAGGILMFFFFVKTKKNIAEWHTVEHKVIFLLRTKVKLTFGNIVKAPMILAGCGVSNSSLREAPTEKLKEGLRVAKKIEVLLLLASSSPLFSSPQ